MLSGDFAEFVMDFDRHLTAHLLTHGRWRALLGYLREKRRHGQPVAAQGREIVSSVTPGRVLWAYRRLRPRRPAPEWVDGRRVHRVGDAEPSPRTRWLRQQLSGFIGPGTGLEAYRTVQEAHGVSVRSPWGDVDLWQFFLSLPAEQKIPGVRRKELVRRLMRGRVPDSVLDRTDRTNLREFLAAGVDYPSVRRWIGATEYRMPGVDYPALRRELDGESMGAADYLWARELAAIHAFVAVLDSRPPATVSAETA